ncbi:hypothetical protein [Frankia sp. Cas3]|uniref:hypothetical protein n=1 Tax=Frankia sp. Cas3 TaxID=3073926 RepID=UPI002AD33249|nr:hypothetical protein [Frankia sp. Cas3]
MFGSPLRVPAAPGTADMHATFIVQSDAFVFASTGEITHGESAVDVDSFSAADEVA